MFEQRIELSNGHAKASASDQTIVIRPFAMAVKITLAGEEINIKPPSFFTSRIIDQFKRDYLKKMRKQRDVSVEVSKRLNEKVKDSLASIAKEKPIRKNKKQSDAPEEIDTKEAEIIFEVYDQIQDELWKIADINDREMIRLAQLIVLDNKFPEWRDKGEGFPSDELLEKHMPYNKLYKHADLAEMQTLFDVYDQMNKPEMPRKNFQRLGVILGESSPSPDSGAEFSRFSAGSRTGG